MRLSHRTSPRASVVRVLRTDRDDAQPNRATSARGLIAACAFLFVGVLAAAPARAADAFDAAAKLVPGNAASAILLPSPKGASDDLQQAIDRMGRAETGLGGRPIDLLKAWLGFGAGFDDRGAVAPVDHRVEVVAPAVGTAPPVRERHRRLARERGAQGIGVAVGHVPHAHRIRRVAERPVAHDEPEARDHAAVQPLGQPHRQERLGDAGAARELGIRARLGGKPHSGSETAGG